MNSPTKFIIATIGLLALAAPAKAAIGVCGPDNGNGCALAGEQEVFFNEIHDSGNVGWQHGPQVFIIADTGTLDILIPGFHFTGMVFEIQFGDFEIKPTSGGGVLADFIEKVSPDAAFQFNVTADRMDGLSLVADPLSTGVFEIKRLEVSGLVADVPEASTWAMLIVGFGLMGLGGWRRGRSATGARVISSPLV